MDTDTSDFALRAILSQLSDDDQWHPVAFHSRKFSDAEINYDVHDKEMSAIVAAFKERPHLFIAVKVEITVYTDHRNLNTLILLRSLTVDSTAGQNSYSSLTSMRFTGRGD